MLPDEVRSPERAAGNTRGHEPVAVTSIDTHSSYKPDDERWDIAHAISQLPLDTQVLEAVVMARDCSAPVRRVERAPLKRRRPTRATRIAVCVVAVCGVLMVQSYLRAATPEPGSLPLARAVLTHNAADVETLIEKGANPDARAQFGEDSVWRRMLKPAYGRTPLLSVAARSGDYAVAAALLSHGADPDSRDADGATPLMWAASSCRAGRQCRRMIELLIAHRADVFQKDSQGRTALERAQAAGNGAAVQILTRLSAQ